MDSLEVVITRLESHMFEAQKNHKDFQESVKEVRDSIKDLYVRIEQKVSYKRYTWQFGIELMILFAMFGYLILQVDGLKKDSGDIKSQVSYINGVFENNGVEVKK